MSRFANGDKVITKVKYWSVQYNTNGKPFASVTFENGVRWQGYLVDGAYEITTKALHVMGFKGRTAADLDNPTALNKTKDVQIEIELEEYKGKTYTKAKWVNDVYKKKKLDPKDVKSLQGIDLRAYMMDHQKEDGIDQYANGSGKTASTDQQHDQQYEDYQQQTSNDSKFTADTIPF